MGCEAAALSSRREQWGRCGRDQVGARAVLLPVTDDIAGTAKKKMGKTKEWDERL